MAGPISCKQVPAQKGFSLSVQLTKLVHLKLPGEIREILNKLPPPHTAFMALQLDTAIIAQNATRPVGERTSQFMANWNKLTQDQWVLSMAQGYQLPLIQWPDQAMHQQVGKKPTICFRVGGTEVSRKRSNTAGTVVPGAPNQPDVCCPQKQKRLEANYRFKVSKLLSGTCTFQDGGLVCICYQRS